MKLAGMTAALVIGAPAHAREARETPGLASPSVEAPKNVITLEPLAVVYARTIALEYERGIGRVGLHLGSALTLGSFDSADSNGDYLAVAVTLGMRIYPWTDAPEGPFVGPFGSVAWVDADDGTTAVTGVGWSVGAMVGWTWLLGSVFALSLGAGAAWYSYGIERADGTTAGHEGFLPALRLAVGAAF